MSDKLTKQECWEAWSRSQGDWEVMANMLNAAFAARPQEQASRQETEICNAGHGPVEECPAHGEAAKRFFGASQPAEAQDDEWPPCCQEAHDFGLQAGRLEAKQQIEAAYQRGQQDLAEKAASWCEQQTGDFAQFFTPENAAQVIRAMGGNVEPPQDKLAELVAKWRARKKELYLPYNYEYNGYATACGEHADELEEALSRESQDKP